MPLTVSPSCVDRLRVGFGKVGFRTGDLKDIVAGEIGGDALGETPLSFETRVDRRKLNVVKQQRSEVIA